MTTSECAGDALFQLHEGNRSIALAFAATLRRLTSPAEPAPTSLASPTFGQHEPDLAIEAAFAARR